MRNARTVLTTICLAAGAILSAAGAGETVVLDGRTSVWRTYVEWASPVVLKPDGTKRGLIPLVHFWLPSEWTGGKPAPAWTSPRPAEGWNSPDFDDADWERRHCPVGPDLEVKRWNHPGFTMWSDGSPSQVASVFTRGRFEVLDPAGAGLTLEVKFCGAAIVYVNGREVGRAHVLEKPLGGGVRGEPYADDVYVGKDGEQISGKAGKKSTPAQLAAYAKRVRELSVKVPASALRKGVNVLAVEVLRSAYKEIYRSKPKGYKGKDYCAWPWPWPHCRLLNVKLSATGAGEVTPNVGRPKGVSLWKPHPWATVTGFSYGCSREPVRTIRMVGFRGGAFSDQLAVGSAAAISALSVTTTDLKGDAGSIAAKHVRVSYARPDGNRFTALLEKAPSPVPVTHFKRHRKDPGIKVAVQPIWITVRVPRDAGAGRYAGSVEVAAQGLKATTVPLELEVQDWKYPDFEKLGSQSNLWQCHEIHALRYNVPLWSDEHFGLIGRCLELSKPLVNRFCHVPMTVGGFQCGNRQSMVRWIPKGGENGAKKYDYDFKIFDRYLDLFAGKLGKPRVLMIDVCVPIHSRSRPKDGTNPIKVSKLDPETGKVEPMSQPAYGTPEGVAFWKPVLTEVRKRLEKRGWWDVALLGTASDSGPTKGEAQTFDTIWPGKGWAFSGHPRVTKVGGGRSAVKSRAWVWGNGRLWTPGRKNPKYPRPWRGGMIQVAFPRAGCSACTLKKDFPLSDFRTYAEKNMQCGQWGVGRVGLDYWRFRAKDARGRVREMQLHNSGGQFSFDTSIPYFVAPGPGGPVLTTHGELYREGLQVREAMTYLLRALDDGKLPAALAAEVEKLILTRARKITKVYCFRTWREDENRLFSLCAKVAKASGE